MCVCVIEQVEGAEVRWYGYSFSVHCLPVSRDTKKLGKCEEGRERQRKWFGSLLWERRASQHSCFSSAADHAMQWQQQRELQWEGGPLPCCWLVHQAGGSLAEASRQQAGVSPSSARIWWDDHCPGVACASGRHHLSLFCWYIQVQHLQAHG